MLLPNSRKRRKRSHSVRFTPTIEKLLPRLMLAGDGIEFHDPFAGIDNFDLDHGWTSQDQHPRHVVDVNGDARPDIVAFGADTWTSLNRGDGTFAPPLVAIDNFDIDHGWTSQNRFPRQIVDVNGDALPDIVGFGADTWTSLNNGDGTFQTPFVAIDNFDIDHGWTSQDRFPRQIVDVNGDALPDIVGFGADTWTSLNNGDGTFQTPVVAIDNFDIDHGWTSQNEHPRQLVDVNGDTLPDIVGFGADTWTSLNNGDGTFQTPFVAIDNFDADHGWTSQDQFPREIIDVNGDALPDIVGFGADTWTSLNNGDGTFQAPFVAIDNFDVDHGWFSQNEHPRQMVDVNGDALPDIVGFGSSTWVALNAGGGTFGTPFEAIDNFDLTNNWNSQDAHPRFIADLNGDAIPDIVGFGTNTWVSLGNEVTFVGLAWGHDVPRSFRALTLPTGVQIAIEEPGTTPAADVNAIDRAEIRARLTAMFADSGIERVRVVDGAMSTGTNVYLADALGSTGLLGKAYTGIDRFDQRARDEVVVFLTGSNEIDAEVAAHEVGHSFGLRHVNPSFEDDPLDLSLMDYDDAPGDSEQFIDAVSEITEPPDCSGCGTGITHNPVYHLRRYVDGVPHADLLERGIIPGDWDLEDGGERVASRTGVSLDFADIDVPLYDVRILTSTSRTETSFTEIASIPSTTAAGLREVSLEMELGEIVQLLASSSSAGAHDIVLTTGNPLDAENLGVAIVLGDTPMELHQITESGSSSIPLATGTATGSSQLAGDFDNDLDVDGDDFLAWQAGFGASTDAMRADGDADGDRDVDGDDFLIWQSNFGADGAPHSAHAAPPDARQASTAELDGAPPYRNARVVSLVDSVFADETFCGTHGIGLRPRLDG